MADDISLAPVNPARTQLVLVTGLAGAGHSTSLHVLEDFGFEAIDNLPLRLLPALLVEKKYSTGRKLAVGVDSRTRGIASSQGISQLAKLRARPDIDVKVVFLEAEDSVLVRRFQLARRPHPLDSYPNLAEAIAAERTLLRWLREKADTVINTSTLTPAQLRDIFIGMVMPERQKLPVVQVQSFSYRGGLPFDADMVLDARFLRNPFYEAALRPKTGRDEDVAAYIRQDDSWQRWLSHVTGMLPLVLDGYSREGRPYFTLAVGCSGGQHRSVFAVEQLTRWLREQGWRAYRFHRELPE